MTDKYHAKITVDTDEDFFLRIGNKDISSIGSYTVTASTAESARDKVMTAVMEAKVTWAKRWNIDGSGKSYASAWDEAKKYLLDSIIENPDTMYWYVGGNHTITVAIDVTF